MLRSRSHLACAAACFIFMAAAWSAAAASSAKLSAPLAARLASAKPSELVPVVIHLRRGVSPDEIRFAGQGLAPDARRKAVGQLLRTAADAAQARTRALLERARLAGTAERVRPLWLINAIGANLTPSTIERIAALDEVERIGHSARARLADAAGAPAGCAATAAPQPAVDAPAAGSMDWGVRRMGAPAVWSTYGTRGEGVVIAVIDTGSCYNHPDIKSHVWVNPGEDLNHNGVVMDAADKNGLDDDGNGYVDDFVGWDFGAEDNDPQDTDGHGSHTAGTLVGDGASGTATGMAPGAKLMILRLSITSVGWTDEVNSWLALQYAADNGARVVSMSYGWLHAEGPDRAGWRELLDTLHAMGLITFACAGNSGTGAEPENVWIPADVPSMITVGATDRLDAGAWFSSTGPVGWDDVAPYRDHPYPPGLLKPDVAAPGVDTISLDRCAGYTAQSGTSMATPHVAGAAALVLSRKPDTDQAEMKQILASTAIDVGAPGPDLISGYGRVDALAAAGAISGWVQFASFRVLDPAPLQGNGNGAAEPGELVTLPLTLHNSRPAGTARAVSAVVTSSTAGIVVHDGVAYFPDIAAGASAESLSPHITFGVGAPCDGYATFHLVTRYDDGRSSSRDFLVRIGYREEQVLFSDDFETNKGWARSGPVTSGMFVREDPHQAVAAAGYISQPEDDHSPGGTRCYVTGNRFPIANADADDLDGGPEELISPRFDTSGWTEGRLDFWSWCAAGGQGLLNADNCAFSLSNDDGATWMNLEYFYYPGKRKWTRSEYSLHVMPSSNRMRLKMEVTDAGPDSCIDALLDDVTVTGWRTVCDAYTPPAQRAPNGVGSTLRLSRSGQDVRLEWQVPAVDGGHDAATLYRVDRSNTAAAPPAPHATATVPWHVAAGEAASSAARFYLVWAQNGGGTESPD